MPMAPSQAPLLTRSLDEPIARIGQPLTCLGLAAGEVRVADFLRQVWSLAEQLPQASHAINLCENRYSFLLAFCAVIVRQQTNLLPSNRGIATQQWLAQRYPACYVLHDGLETCAELPNFAIGQADLREAALSRNPLPKHPLPKHKTTVPLINLDHVAAIPFTSGSTGEPVANIKTWHTFVASSKINASYMLPQLDSLHYALATVPGQHMWGLETSILMPLFASVCIDDGKPLFPQDIAKRLHAMPEPRLLISTPVHLRALTLSEIQFPQVETVLCATAPLTKELARATEQCFAGQLGEVFGCSEVGSMAWRRTADTDTWTLFDGLRMQQTATGEMQIVAEHLPDAVTLQDNIERLGQQTFKLLGRGADMLEIAGKRGSLLEMNKILQSHPEVVDAVVFLPDTVLPEKDPLASVAQKNLSREKQSQVQQPQIQRLAALVVLKNPQAKASIQEFLRARIDPVFIPRPIVAVESLPREENGKLPRSKLLAFYNTLNKK